MQYPTTDKTTHFEITGELSDGAVDALADLILAVGSYDARVAPTARTNRRLLTRFGVKRRGHKRQVISRVG